MSKQVEKLAKTVDDAVREALKELGADIEDVLIEVLDEGDQGGLLGFGRRPARVRVSLAEEDKSEEQTPAYAELRPAFIELDENAEDDDDEFADEFEDEDDYDEDYDEEYEEEYVDEYDEAEDHGRDFFTAEEQEDIEDKAVEFVATILQSLGAHGRISSYYADDGSLRIDVSGDDLGNAIGRAGETLNAIQYLTTLAANKDSGRYQRIFVDIDFYKDRRMRQLRQRARRSAERVLKSRRRYVMKPMSAAERRQIHLALADFQGIQTYSEGEEPDRSVVIDLEA